MAYKDSGEIATNSNYTLGDYSFRVERTSVPGSTNDKIEAICTQGGKNARKSIQVSSSTQLEGWYVEANETEATVYSLVKIPKSGGGTSSDLIDGDIAYGTIIDVVYGKRAGPLMFTAGAYLDGYARRTQYPEIVQVKVVDELGSYTYSRQQANLNRDKTITLTDITTQTGNAHSYTYNGKTVYFIYAMGFNDSSYYGYHVEGVGSATGEQETAAGKVAWTMKYGDSPDPEYETKEMMIGRFAIDVEDAGGVGPGGGIGGGWTDPEDYDEDWEEGDPTHTLYVEVTGALSGRHNDPIEDPSYSYIPADKDTVKDYGCGGDGGHGGGGGAGASTVVIHKFATNQANSKEVTAIARRHGYGSGGGKGGKGGDGCILVYY